MTRQIKSALSKFDALEKWAWGALVAGNLYFAVRFVNKLDTTADLVAAYGTSSQVNATETRLELAALKGDVKRLDALLRDISGKAKNPSVEDAAYCQEKPVLPFSPRKASFVWRLKSKEKSNGRSENGGPRS